MRISKSRLDGENECCSTISNNSTTIFSSISSIASLNQILEHDIYRDFLFPNSPKSCLKSPTSILDPHG